jgi:tRNA uridine 5-carboxymethylaminomethyl modification enzyme
MGLVDDQAHAAFEERMAVVKREHERIGAERVTAQIAASHGLPLGASLAEMLRRPDVSYADVAGDDGLTPDLGERVEIALKYEGYIRRQAAAAERLSKADSVRIPNGFLFDSCTGMSREAREKLSSMRPATLGQAGRIPGITPADIAVLSVYLRRREKEQEVACSEQSG